MRYAAPTFPYGVMLTVVRHSDPARNWEGDFTDDVPTEHTIGPCDFSWVLDRTDTTQGEQRMERAQVTAPEDADVIDTDQIKLPDGQLMFIDGHVRITPNSFTGWISGKRFLIAKDGANGLRRS